MDNEIVKILNNKMTSNLSIGELSKILGRDKEEIEEVIKYLVENGTVYKDKRDKYGLVSKSSMKVGTVKVTKRKGAIVVFDDRKELDLILNSHSKVLHNDRVLVEPYYKGGTCQLVSVIKRTINDYVGTVVFENNNHMLVFKDKPSVKVSKVYPIGTKLVMDGKTGHIKEILGHITDPNMKIKELFVEHGVPTGYKEEYLRELESIPESLSEEDIIEFKKNKVLDIRKLPVVTIDGDDTKDFDDALSFYDNHLYVSIAKVPYYIQEGSFIENDVIERGTSYYPPGMVNPMLHHKISNGICSLNPNEDRFTSTSVSRFTSSGDRISCKFINTIINSKKRMTYEEVNKILEENIVPNGYEEYVDMIKNLYNFAMRQKKKMLNEGFLQFSSTEIKVIFDMEKITDIKKRHHGKAEELIEFLMLYHNLEMTSEFIRRGLPFIARNHDEPNMDKINAWNNLLRIRGYKVDGITGYTNEDIKKNLKSYEGASEKIVLDSIAIRAQSKAKYSAYNRGHFALGVKAYATFTSPIRRLSDYINQRILDDANKYGDSYAIKKWEPRMENLARIATNCEIKADKIERQASKYKMAEYMENHFHKGDKFNALIFGIKEGKLSILLPNGIYGNVYYNVKDYNISKDGFCLINNSNKETLIVGDSMEVTFKSADCNTGEIVFSRDKCKEYNNEEKGKRKVKNR